jgi:hypothetical protein
LLVGAWVLGFIVQGIFRAWYFRHVPVMPMSSAAFIVFTLYMVPDPATTPIAGSPALWVFRRHGLWTPAPCVRFVLLLVTVCARRFAPSGTFWENARQSGRLPGNKIFRNQAGALAFQPCPRRSPLIRKTDLHLNSPIAIVGLSCSTRGAHADGIVGNTLAQRRAFAGSLPSD